MKRDNGHYIMTGQPIHQEDITIANIYLYLSNIRIPKYTANINISEWRDRLQYNRTNGF